MYECQFCNEGFKYKSHLERHLNRKKPCYTPTITDDIIENLYTASEKKKIKKGDIKKGYHKKIVKGVPQWSCNLCGYTKNNKGNLPNHVKLYCKEYRKRILVKIQNGETNKKDVSILEKELAMMKERMQELEDKCEELSHRKNIIVQNIINGNQKLPIQPIGKEDLSFINGNMYRKTIENPPQSLSYLTKMLNFDPNKLFNWNIHKNTNDYITYLDQDNMWKIRHKTEFAQLLSSIRENQSYDLEKKFRGEGLSLMIDKYLQKKEKMGEEYDKISFDELINQIEEGTTNNDLYILDNKNLIVKKLNLQYY